MRGVRGRAGTTMVCCIQPYTAFLQEAIFHVLNSQPLLVTPRPSLPYLCSTYSFLFVHQTNKEKISFGRLEVHEIAAFVLNSSGNYEAINRNCPHYYLSAESVALFTDHLPSRPSYIVGLVVHIERQTVRSSTPSTTTTTSVRADHDRDLLDILTSDTGTSRLSLNSGSTTTNPYGLPVGCEYFVVTVAMLPDTTIHSPPPS